MTDLESLKNAILDLTPEQYWEIKQFLIENQPEPEAIPPVEEDVETRLAKIHEALAAIREGLSEEDLNEIVWAMNYEYIDKKALHEYDWLDEPDSDER
jgi:FAD/FMN-containing dehydrogenase